MRTAIHTQKELNTPQVKTLNPIQQLLKYNYDQLNRITRTRNIELESGKFQITNKYNENYTYDPNGNILTLNRTNGQGETFDFLSYNYDISLNNQLRQVTDEGGDTNAASNDFDNYERYEYDEIGNLIYLEGNGETSRMTWTIYGKLETVVKENQATNILTTITYLYDAMGNRVHKSVVKEDNSGNMSSSSRGKYQTTYWRDAQGNVLKSSSSGFVEDLNGVRTSKNSEEFVIYGSSRLGTYSPELTYNPYTGQVEVQRIEANTLTLGYKAYELSNHLGNVLTTISDNYFAQNSTAEVAARVLSSQDYFPFGMVMTERSFVEKQERKYRYGFNGKENDEDLEGQDYGFRIYRENLGKFLSVDPLSPEYPELTPYQFASNSPIINVDLDGLEAINLISGKMIKIPSQPELELLNASDYSFWKDMLQWEKTNKVTEVLNQRKEDTGRILDEQKLENASGSQLNTDYYAVRIDKLPPNVTAEDLYNVLRVNIGAFMDPAIANLKPSEFLFQEDQLLWQSEDPTGATMTFINPADDAAVLTSKAEDNFWVFTPIHTFFDQRHPLAGHRQFGLTDNGDGSVTFYTRGVDRMWSEADRAYNAFYPGGGGEQFFRQGDQLWNHVMDKVAQTVNNSGGHATKTHNFTRRIDWEEDVQEEDK